MTVHYNVLQLCCTLAPHCLSKIHFHIKKHIEVTVVTRASLTQWQHYSCIGEKEMAAYLHFATAIFTLSRFESRWRHSGLLSKGLCVCPVKVSGLQSLFAVLDLKKHLIQLRRSLEDRNPRSLFQLLFASPNARWVKVTLSHLKPWN